jgi:hypothetical protein
MAAPGKKTGPSQEVPFHSNEGTGVSQGAAAKMGQGSDRKPVPKLSLGILKRAADLLKVSCQQLSLQVPLVSLQASKSLFASVRQLVKHGPLGLPSFQQPKAVQSQQVGIRGADRVKASLNGPSWRAHPSTMTGKKPLVLFA